MPLTRNDLLLSTSARSSAVSCRRKQTLGWSWVMVQARYPAATGTSRQTNPSWLNRGTSKMSNSITEELAFSRLQRTLPEI